MDWWAESYSCKTWLWNGHCCQEAEAWGLPRPQGVVGEFPFSSSSWILQCHFCLPCWLRSVNLQTEVNYLGQLRHPNLVKLIGYCSEGDNRLLVYEFMPEGSLENHLFRSKFHSEMSIFSTGSLIMFWILMHISFHRRGTTSLLGN